MKSPQLFAIALFGLFLGGCAKPPQTGKGFYLPAGNASRGQVAFVHHNCTACHTVHDATLPLPTTTTSPIIQLGGDVTRVRSYGDLVTAIIYPSHTISDLVPPEKRSLLTVTPMAEMTDTMTVTELVDIVTFLQPRYKQVMRTTYGYGYPLPP